jgi:uncharacterized protein
MKILLDDIEASPKALSYTEGVEELNARLGRGVRDYHVPEGLEVALEYYRAGFDLFFEGSLGGTVLGTCARCLEEYRFPLAQRFHFVLTPRAAADTESARLTPDDLTLSTYDGEEINLTPLMHEQAILALPTRPLCAESCRGLCPRCGANLNASACGCPAIVPEPRLAVLRTLIRGK